MRLSTASAPSFALAVTLFPLLVHGQSDIDIVRQRRLSNIVGSSTGAANIATWISSLQADGTWPDVDYTTGCSASTSSWPAQTHWSRINTFASAFHGGFKNAANWTGDTTLRAAASRAMIFWFNNDFTTPACLDQGGTAACQCGTPGLWNTNWFSNVILIPQWVGQVCLSLNTPPSSSTGLSAAELAGCTRMTSRAFNTLQTGVVGVSAITGANLLDIASIGIDFGLFSANASVNAVAADGIRADGAFGQHAGLLYNGAYGKDYADDVFNLEIAAGGTQFQATSSSMAAFTALLTADWWMIFRNTVTNVLHWDYTVIGRNIAQPVSDKQQAADTELNITEFQVLGSLWGSSDITSVFNALNTGTGVNPGGLVGNRMFYTNDYMVHRGSNYVVTLKMYGKRTQNTECVNNQNMLGFHLADGAMYTYTTGNEYQDVFSAWDWNLIPGITVDYGATPLSCSTARKSGIQPYVGGVSDGTVGMAAMRYDNPTTRAMTWRKTYFFLQGDIVFVMIALITSTTSAPVYSVLDQRVRGGDVFVNGNTISASANVTGASSLWHAGTGYTFNATNPATSLSVTLGPKTGNWQAIGSSKAAPNTVDMFTAYLPHHDISQSATYAMYPGTTQAQFAARAAAEPSALQVVRNDGSISALIDVAHNTAYIAFWTAAGSTFTLPSQKSGVASIQVKANANSALILHMDSWTVWAADPTQTITAPLVLNFTLLSGTAPAGWGSVKSRVVNIALPTGGMAGASVSAALP
ncbi:Polysaccharide lyase family 8 protein [Mycena indigotica]|uniref:Polysaccharide lyase family 8 protein n=1 Tax=Mycena indigotica TaxID=2126181 RepID=A0A8H6T6N0_9AGAR|nr:Polysaccharide lyase family 8 protein [Mycena indigotica]KAF7311916.1 Polysaccharide lyase family 8 protein [Mycena indigotica]